MSVHTLHNAEGSISGFSRIETRSQRQNKALKEHTASDALPEKGKSANQSAHVFALGCFLNRRYYMVAHGYKFDLPMFNSIAYE